MFYDGFKRHFPVHCLFYWCLHNDCKMPIIYNNMVTFNIIIYNNLVTFNIIIYNNMVTFNIIIYNNLVTFLYNNL